VAVIVGRPKIVIEGKTTEKVTEFKYIQNRIPEFKKDMEFKAQICNRMDSIIKINFGVQMTTQTKLRIYNIT
jgi:hypothetical protein